MSQKRTDMEQKEKKGGGARSRWAGAIILKDACLFRWLAKWLAPLKKYIQKKKNKQKLLTKLY